MRVGDAVDALALLTNSAGCGRQNRMVLTPRRWREVGENKVFANDGGKKADRRGEYDISRKTIARGMPGDSGVT
jgi:hypothetical protein